VKFDLEALVDALMPCRACVHLERCTRLDGAVPQQPVADLQRIPDRQRKRRVREQGHLQPKAQDMRVQNADRIVIARTDCCAECGEVLGVDPHTGPSFDNSRKAPIARQRG